MSTCLCQTDDCLLCEAHLNEGLSDAQACEIQGLVRRRSVSTHEVVFHQGDTSGWLYVVRDGQLKLSVSGPDGREQIIRLAVAGQMIGYDTVDDLRHPYTATALTSAQLCGLRHRDMLRVLEENQTVAQRMMQLLNQELSQAQALIRILGQKSTAEKIALFLLSLVPAPRAPNLPMEAALPLSRQEIADLLGVTVETVSRMMADLKRDRIIEAPRGRLRILDPQGLRAYAGTKPLSTNRGLLPAAN